jgi:hypothetical protein
MRMTTPTADRVQHLLELLGPIRPSIEELVHEQAGIGAVTGLLAAIPQDVGERIGGVWAGIVRRVPDGELRGLVSNEDRLLLDLVLSMSDDRRSFSPAAGADRV